MGDCLVDEESKVLDGLGVKLNVLLELVDLVLEVLEVLVSGLFDILIKELTLKILFVFRSLQI